jgi:hypothetical protein
MCGEIKLLTLWQLGRREREREERRREERRRR